MNNMYATRNPLIVLERVQPAFSQLILKHEGIDFPIYVNETAAEVLRICDGTKRISDIHKILSDRYGEPVSEIAEKLHDFWIMSSKCNHIILSEQPININNTFEVLGSKEFWTPDLLSVEITHNCPLKCKHCFLSAGQGETMSNTLWHLILNSITTMSIPQVQLTGGEPLLHPAFFDMLDDLLNLGVITHIFTSGVVFSEEILNRFADYSNHKKRILFQISLDGLEECHDSFRGVKGSFKRSIAFVREIVKLGYKVSVGVTVTNQTLEELIELCRLCKSIGVSVVRIGGVSNRGRAKDNSLSSTSEELSNMNTYKTTLAEMFESESFKVQLNEENNSNATDYLMNCGLGQTSVKIDPVGYVYPCIMASVPYANINNESLLDIQKKYSRRFEKLSPPSEQQCSECDRLSLCNKCIVEGCLNSDGSCRWFSNNYTNLKGCALANNNE